MDAPMKRKGTSLIAWALVLAGMIFMATACSPPKPEPVKTVTIPDGEYDPAVWGKAYPLEYDSWLKSKNPTPPGLSKYKRGFDTTLVKYDKLSEYPYMALLFNGWGFGVEYNEPRGHYYMLIDQLEIDPSRLKSGGACLTCKTPFAPKLRQEMGVDFFKLPYLEVHAKIPQPFQRMGVACIDCHDNKTMDLKLSRWTLNQALKDMGKDPKTASRQEKRSLVCAQCHVTYVVKKDLDMKSIAVFFPWQGSRVGNISIENIIYVLKSDPANLEWTQKVSDMKLAFIRHPEYEFYSKNSIHWNANVACADCHMPYTRVGVNKISNHNVGSPFIDHMQACQQCHAESAQWLKDRVIAIQDRTVSLLSRAGYATAVAAKLLEAAHKAQFEGKNLDKNLCNRAVDLYQEAFYRITFMGAENSVGFHNPTEAGRILGDSVAMAEKSSALLRQALAQVGVNPAVDVPLELARYLNNRGVKNLNFQPQLEFRDPYGTQEMLTPAYSLGK
jgi:nitrite reductase (cytochrome c-552)